MRRSVLTATLALSALLALPACTQGDGPVVDQTREVAAFTRIEAGAGVHVKLTIGTAGPIVVHAQENIQDKVRTGVREGTLRIEATDDFVVADPVVVDVVAPTVEAVSLSGGAAIELEGLEAGAVDVSLSGGSRATISGMATSVALTATGGSTASLGDLDAGMVTVSLDGGATAEVLARDSVRGSASGGATLRVRGEATIEVDASGGAEVSPG